MALRRLVIGEATRFPDLGRMFYELGPQRTLDALARSFERLAQRGLLHFETAHVAAEHFNWLIMSTPMNRAMFLGEDTLAAGEMARYAESGVRVFLAAYATEGSRSPD